jgi:hypothetical protein
MELDLVRRVRDHYTKWKKSHAELENSEEQSPTDSADAPQTRRKKKVYQINQLLAKRAP